MVLTEAFAAGTPVVASDIAGYRDVVPDGVDGLLVPRGDATRAGRDAARPRARPARAPSAGAPPRAAARRALRLAARRRAGRRGLRGRARRARRPTARRAARRRADRRAARRRQAARRRPAGCRSLEPAAVERRPRRSDRPPRGARRCDASAAGVGTLLAVERIGLRPDRRTRSCDSQPGLGARRAGADVRLDAAARRLLARDPAAALPEALPRLVDAIQGTTIGVLMSATLPARLGEPSRALIVARRLGRAARPPARRARHDRLADAASTCSRW